MPANAAPTFLSRLHPVKFTSSFRFRTSFRFLHFKHLLNSCSSLSQLKWIHALILVTGIHHSLPLSTKLITVACKVGPTMDYARKLFDRMPEPDAFAWNTLIRGYAALGPCTEALLLYKDMHGAGLLPDNYTFTFVLRSSAVLSAMKEGKEAHCNIIKKGLDSDVFVQSSLLSMYAQCGETLSMEILFRGMGVRNTISWTAIIAGYVQNGFFKQGLRAFRDMVASGTQPNAITLASILPACPSLKVFNCGKLIHGYGFKLGVDSNISVVNALIALYGKGGNLDVARSLFDRTVGRRNLVSWNAMIAAYEQNNAGSDAIKLFRRMQCEKVEYDYVTLVSVISACANLGALKTGKWIHELVKRKGFESSISITNALINMYAKCGNINQAKDVFERLHHRSVVSWTSLIGACASHGHGVEALNLFSKMQEDGIRPNLFTFTAILSACRHSGLIEEGRKHFESITKDYAMLPGIEQCACVVDLLGRAGRLTEAYEFIARMPVEPDVSVWGALLGACRIHGNVELAELVAEQLFQLDDPQTVAFYVLMSNIYAEAGRWEDAARLKTLMREREVQKIPGQSSVEVNRKFYSFLSRSCLRYSVR